MKTKAIILTLSMCILSLFAYKLNGQETTRSADSIQQQQKIQKMRDSEKMDNLKNTTKETKAEAKESQRISREADAAARETKNALKAEKKAQKARKKADEQSAKAAKAKDKSDQN